VRRSFQELDEHTWLRWAAKARSAPARCGERRDTASTGAARKRLRPESSDSSEHGAHAMNDAHLTRSVLSEGTASNVQDPAE
jgi:hypothetical protein